MLPPQRRILILCKTYPSPSAKYTETSCVAGLDADGNLVRLYPVPLRMIGDDKQFKKWQWITARVRKAPKDHRPESHNLLVDTIVCDPKPLSTSDNWRERRRYIDKLPVFDSFEALELARQQRKITLGLLRPRRIIALEIEQADAADWTPEEKAKLLQAQKQAGLFDETDAASIHTLRKLPYDFYYRYECDTPAGRVECRHKLVDWEAGALFWKMYNGHRADWQSPFREKLEHDLPSHDLIFLMGTIDG
jgi:hypothetical protein